MHIDTKLYFDSTNFTILDIRRGILDGVLKRYHLNLTKYCVLLKCLEVGCDALTVKEAAAAIHVQTNVVTQSVNDLERQGLVRRVVSSVDARSKHLILEPAASSLPVEIEDQLHEELGPVFNPENDSEQLALLRESTRYSGRIGGLWGDALIARYPLSASVTAISVFARDVRNELKERLGLPLTDCRIIQVIAEEREPQRPVDLAVRLLLSTATITTATGHMVEQGILRRLAEPGNKRDVYYDVTEKGSALQEALYIELRRLEKGYWGQLDSDELELSQVIRRSFLRRQELLHQQERSARLNALVEAQ